MNAHRISYLVESIEQKGLIGRGVDDTGEEDIILFAFPDFPLLPRGKCKPQTAFRERSVSHAS